MIKYDLSKEEFITQSNWEIYFESDDSEIDSIIQKLSKIYDKLQMYKAMMEQHYPCQLEYEFNRYYDNFWEYSNYENTQYYQCIRNIRLTWKVDKIQIQNSKKQKHEINDLYVSLYFGLNEDNGYTMHASLYGFKSTFTYSETYEGYIHSHLPTTKDIYIGNYYSFCLGNGSMDEMMDTLQNDFIFGNAENENIHFELFCHHLHEYLSWESLAGVPHIKIERLGLAHNGQKAKKSFTRFVTTSNKTVYEGLLKSYPQLHSKLICENNVYTDIVLPENADIKFWKDVFSNLNSWTVLVNNDNTHLVTNDGIMQTITNVDTPHSYFEIHERNYYFKGEKVIGKIIPDNVPVLEEIASPLKIFIIKTMTLNYLNNEQ